MIPFSLWKTQSISFELLDARLTDLPDRVSNLFRALMFFIFQKKVVNHSFSALKGLGNYGFRIDYQRDLARNAHCAS